MFGGGFRPGYVPVGGPRVHGAPNPAIGGGAVPPGSAAYELK